MTPEQIIEREVRAQRPDATIISAHVDEENERWVLLVDCSVYVMEISSDDDKFVFTAVHFPKVDKPIAFDFPEDWPV